MMEIERGEMMEMEMERGMWPYGVVEHLAY